MTTIVFIFIFGYFFHLLYKLIDSGLKSILSKFSKSKSIE